MHKKLLPAVIFALIMSGCAENTLRKEDTASGIETPNTIVTPSPEAKKDETTKKIFAMDTVMEFTAYTENIDILDNASQYVRDLENKISPTIKNSQIYNLNEAGNAEFTDDAFDLMDKALKLCKVTNGALDITMYPLTEAWGFVSGNNTVPSQTTINELMTYVGYSKVSLDSKTKRISVPTGTKVDLGSVAKGYTGDEIINIFRENGVESAMINLGGNVQTLGTKPNGEKWIVAIQNPLKDGSIGKVKVSDKAVVTSGIYERYFKAKDKKYGHILDPKTGAPSNSNLASVTIIGDEGLRCDGLSTGLFVLGLENAKKVWRYYQDFDMVLVDNDGQVFVTEGIYEDFSLSDIAQEYTVEKISIQ